jgi:hypothetical protein
MATIRSASNKILATVAAFSQIKKSQFNDNNYQSVLFEGEGLPNGKVWRSMTPDQAQSFDRDQQVYLVPTTNTKGQPSYDIELIEPVEAPTVAPTQAPSHQAPANAREAYLETLERVGNRYRACIGKAKEIWTSEYSTEDLQALPELLHSTAASLFIEVNRITR